MADSPLLSFISSASPSSRPPSRAQSHASDATERPDTPSSARTLTREVDHIKHLIKRSQNVTSKPQSITAQIFRQRSASTPITLEYICRELDVLKKRIKEEQQQPHPQPPPRAHPAFEHDPDASESEADVEDVLDEREEELERAREEIRIVKQNEEQLLEVAESKVDRLTNEKESLEGTLSGYQDRLEALQKSLQHYQSQLNQLRKDNKEKSSSFNEAQEQISKLQNFKAQADASLQLSSARVSQLEEENRRVTEQVKRLVSQHDARQKELNHEIQALNGRNNAISAGVEELRMKSRALQEKLNKAEAQSARSKKEDDARCKTLLEQVEEQKQFLQNASQEADQHRKEVELLRADRDKVQAHAGELAKQLGEYDEKLRTALQEHKQMTETHRKQVEDINRDHEQALRGMQAGREAELKQLQQTLDEAKYLHAAELDNIKAHNAKGLDAVKDQWRSSLEKLRATHQTEVQSVSTKLADEVLRLNTVHNAELEHVQSKHIGLVEVLRAQLTEMEAQVASTKEAHKAELDTLLAKHDRSLKKAADETNSVRQVMQSAESRADANVKMLQESLREQSEVAEAAVIKVARAEEAHRSRAAELEEDLQQAKARLETSRSAADHLENSLKCRVVELENQLASKDVDLTTLKTDLTTAHQTKNDQVQVLEVKITALLKELTSKDESMRAAEKAQTSAMDQRDKEHADSMEELKSLHAAEVDRLRLDFKQAADSSGGELIQKIAELNETHKTQIDTLTTKLADFEKKLEHAEASSSTEQAQLVTQHQKHIAELEAGWARTRDEHAASHKADLQRAVDEASRHAEAANKHFQEQSTEHESAVEARVTSLQENHARELAQSKADLTAQVETAQDEVESSKAELAKAREEHSIAVEKMRVDHLEQAERLHAQHSVAYTRLQSQHEDEIQVIRKCFETTKAENATAITQHESTLAQLRREHSSELQQMRTNHDDLKLHHLSEIAGLRTAVEEGLARTDELRAQHARQLEETTSAHVSELSVVRSLLDQQGSEHATRAADAERQLAALRVEHATELSKQMQDHKKALADLCDVHSAAEADSQREHEQSLAEQNATRSSEMDTLKEQHSRSINELAQSADVATSTRLQQLEMDHEAALLNAVTRANAEATEKARLVEQQHRAVLESAVDRARQSGQAEVKNLKKRHRDAVAQIRKVAQQQTADQLTSLENSHQQELQATIESHHTHLLHLSTEHQTTLDALQTRLDSQRVAEIMTQEGSHKHEVEALTGRLDAAMTGQAEAERSVARLRQQVSQAEQRVAEDSLSSGDDIAALQQEKTDLTTQLRQVQVSLRELQSKFSNGTTTPKTKHAHEELACVKSQLSTLEADRATSRLISQKRLDEKNDLIRQNEFLVQELETLHAQRLRPQYTARKTRDALIQTEDFVSGEPKVDLTSFQNIKASRRKTARPVTPMSPGQRQARDEIDMAWKTRSFEEYLHNAQTELSELGSVITANETLFAQKIEEHVGELQRVKDELAADYKSKLDDLAADKRQMEQMVTSKQTAAFAKDRQQLVASYGADHDDPSEQIAVLTSLPVNDAVALRTAEERLVQDYNKRIAKRKSQIAIRHAEEYHALTEEYDKKVARLLDNQNNLEGDLSVDPWKFERDLGDLTVQLETSKGRSATKSPVSVRSRRGRTSQQGAPPQSCAAPQSTEQGGPDRPKTAGDSRPPLERWTSHPRTSTSIPRSASVPRGRSQGRRESPEPPAVPMVFFPGGRDSPHSTSQPYQGRGKYPPVAERSLLRTKNPTDVQKPRRVFTEPSPRKAPTKRGFEKADQTLGITATGFDRQTAQPGHGIQSVESPTRPGFLRRLKDRVSLDSHLPHFHRPGSRAGRPSSRNELSATAESEASSSSAQAQAPNLSVPTVPPTLKNKRSRSTNLSSGMIYYQAPKQGPTSTEYE